MKGDIAPSGQMCDASHLSTGQEIQKLADFFGLKKSLTDQQLIRAVVDGYEQAAEYLVRAGVALLLLRERNPHGTYLDALAENGINRFRAAELVRIAERLLALPEEHRKSILAMRKRQIISLSRFSPRELREAAEAGALEELAAVPDIAAWRAQRSAEAGERTRRMLAEVSRPGAPPPGKVVKDPPSLVVAREELLVSVLRAQTEIERARRVAEALMYHTPDAHEQSRIDAAHAVDAIVRDVAAQADALHTLLAKRFGAAVTMPLSGTYHTMPASLIDGLRQRAAESADAELAQRASDRQQRLKLRGRPPKDLDAVIEAARRADEPEAARG